MTAQIAELREAIAVGRAGQPHWRCPLPLRAKIVEYSRNRHASGSSIALIAQDLGLSEACLRRWMTVAAGSGDFRPVRVEDPSPSARGLCLVTPGGYRIEGLTAGNVVDILRSLGC